MILNEGSVFTCSDLTSIPQMKNAVVIAGFNGLNHIVTRVNIMEVPDVIDWVQSGEFLVTTGYPFRDNPDFLINFIPQLVEKKVSAIGIKTKRFIYDIPPKAIEIANYYQFPIFELPPTTIFSNVVREVMERIAAKDAHKLTILQERIYKLSQTILFDDNIDPFLTNLEKLVENPVVLIDSFNEIFYSSPLLKQELSELFNDEFLLSAFHGNIDLRFPYVEVNHRKIYFHVTHIHDQSSNDSVLILFGLNKELTIIDKLTMEKISFLLRLVLLNAQSRHEIELKYIDQFFHDWLLGRIKHNEDLRLRARSSGYEIKENSVEHTFGVIIVNPMNMEPKIEQLNQTVQDFRLIQPQKKEIKITLIESTIVFILVYPPEVQKENLWGSISSFLKSYFKQEFSLCIGKTVSNPLNLNQSYLQSKKVLNIVKKCSITSKYVTYDELGIYQLLYLLPKSNELDNFKNRFILPLLDYEQKNNTPFIETLICYFNNNGNVKKTSEKMFTHYNTIIYRLDRIRDILNISFEDEDDKLQLHLALKLYGMDRKNI